MIQMFPNQAEDIVAFKVTEKITKEDYEILTPLLENKIRNEGKINIFCQIEDLKSMEPQAVWEDLKFDISHLNDFKTVVIVGDKKWHKWMTDFAKPFTNARIRYFDKHEAREAFEWLLGVTDSPSDNLN